MGALLSCGQVARRCGVSPDTVRHYESLGLVPKASRTAAGYRQYPPEVCRRVRVVREALQLGFTLRELGGVMAVRAAGGAPCREVRRLAQRRLEQVEAEIRSLLCSRRRLATALKEWDRRLGEVPEGRRAHLLDALARED
jgi:MerR family copper efflux transcriptional regulator